MLIANPSGFTKSLLGQKRDGNLVCSKEELDQCDILVDPPPPTKDFDTRQPLMMEVQEIVRKTRTTSAPGLLEEREGGRAVEIC